MVDDTDLTDFIPEAEELLDLAEQSLLAIDQGGDVRRNYESIFRAFHSIKGAAGMLKLELLQAHMHKLENHLTENKNQLGKELVDYFLQGTDAARKILKGQPVTMKDPDSLKVSESIRTTAMKRQSFEKKFVGRILSIDDEPEIGLLLKEILAEVNVDVHLETDPTRVLGSIKDFSPHAVLADITMPKLNGVQLSVMIKEKYPDLPVIFVSGYVDKKTLLQAIELGIYGIVEKPFRTNHITGMCLNAIHKSQLLHLLNQTINLIMYQFSDLDAYLVANGKENIRDVIKKELNTLLEQKRQLRFVGK